jgi:hypothetical protein
VNYAAHSNTLQFPHITSPGLQQLFAGLGPTQQVATTHICCSSSNGVAHSFDDDAESGLGKLRYNKRVRRTGTLFVRRLPPPCGPPAHLSCLSMHLNLNTRQQHLLTVMHVVLRLIRKASFPKSFKVGRP